MDEHTVPPVAADGQALPEPTLSSAHDELSFLSPAEVEFSRSPGGALHVRIGDGEVQRANVVCALPLSQPEQFLSVRVDGNELGLIRDLAELPAAQQELVRAELSRRYFRPVVVKVEKISESHGILHWEVETDRGPTRFTTVHPRQSVLRMGHGRYLIADLDNTKYEVADIVALDPRSRRLLLDRLG